MNNFNFDILIVGGGHAGCEAAYAASEFDLNVGLVSMPGIPLASAPCNPAVGGVGKGQVVRELDALGGLMPRLTDYAGIQFRILNESKGPAVRSTRVQIDKDKYAEKAFEILSNRKGLTLVDATVVKITKSANGYTVNSKEGKVITSKTLILTAGTFLNGKLHTGPLQVEGGRVDCDKSAGLDELISSKSKIKRFKTGTPPRLLGKTINFSKMEPQPSDNRAICFHFANKPELRQQKQLDCYLTRTNSNTLTSIRKNKERSPIFNGQIEGVGPRYCPSIEDKAFRYPDKDSHHVFVEPEGLDIDTFYPNGISTSLPVEVQEEFLRTIPGLEEAKIAIPGYAVEYDVVDTVDLKISLEHKEIAGLFTAGQLNGTSGYEEAAGQGFIAGINAVYLLKELEPFKLDRNHSYIGVMVEDLVTSERDEPYRLFTARSESRLYNREDNTYFRLAPYRKSLNLTNDIDNFLEKYLDQRETLVELVKTSGFRATPAWKQYFQEMEYGKIQENITLEELIKRSHLDPEVTLDKELIRMGLRFIPQVISDVANSVKYEGYLERAQNQQEKLSKLTTRKIDWRNLSENSNISFECRQRIVKVQPEDFSQLSRINGIRPATLAYVASNSL